MKEQLPPKIHPLYSCLRDRSVLIVSPKPPLCHILDEEARGMQRMKVMTTGITPTLDEKPVSLGDFVHQKNFDMVAINPHPYILEDIETMVQEHKRLILLTDSTYVDSDTSNAVEKWRRMGIPTVDITVSDEVPQHLAQTMAALITRNQSQTRTKEVTAVS